MLSCQGMTKEIYLDNNATTPVAREVLEAMEPYWRDEFGNPSSMHRKGATAERAVTNTRHTLADILGVRAREVVFTSGATESITTAIQGIAEATKRQGRHIVTTLVEHDCVLSACQKLEEAGWEVMYLPTDSFGAVTPKAVSEAVRDDTSVVSVMHVNNELGTINPINDIAREVKAKNADTTVVSDGVQAFGKLPIDLADIDAYALSAHKIHGPKGSGALVVKNSVKMKPLIVGGGQEENRRSGTHNVPGIVGLGKAAELAYASLPEHDAHMNACREELERIAREIDGAVVHSPPHGLASTLSAAFPGVPAETLLHVLEERGVFISTGSACSSNKDIVSHVIRHITDNDEVRQSTIRFSFSRFTVLDDVKKVGAMLKEEVPALRQVYGYETY